MTPLKAAVATLVAAASLIACNGRIDDRDAPGGVLPREGLGLTAAKPAIVAFAAGWCHPCRHEVSLLNRVAAEYGDRLDVRGALVEGETRGSNPSRAAVEGFAGLDGTRPTYRLDTDPSWQLFDSLGPAAGHQLPLTVLADADGRVVVKFQRSLDYDNDVRPALDALVAGQTPVDAKTPPPSDPNKPRDEWFAVTEWLAAGHDPKSLRDGFELGALEFGFAPSDFGFEKGKFRISHMSDGTKYVAEGLWQSSCELRVYYREDGSFAGAESTCGV